MSSPPTSALATKNLSRTPAKSKLAVPAEVLLPDPEAPPNAICFECGKLGHIAHLCPLIRQVARGACFTCEQTGHYCYTCPISYYPCCKEPHQSKHCPINQVAYTRCGEKGHQTDQCHVKFPNCDKDVRMQLINQDFPNFHHLVNKALILENEKRTVEASCKRKMAFQRLQSSFPQRSAFHGSSSFRPVVASQPRIPIPAPRPNGNGFRTACPAGQPASVNPAANLHYFNCGPNLKKIV